MKRKPFRIRDEAILKEVASLPRDDTLLFVVLLLVMFFGNIVASLALLPLLFTGSPLALGVAFFIGIFIGFIFNRLLLLHHSFGKKHPVILGAVIPFFAVVNVYILGFFGMKVIPVTGFSLMQNPFWLSFLYSGGLAAVYVWKVLRHSSAYS